MLMRFLSLIFISLLLASCARAPQNPSPPAKRIVQNRQVTSFNRVMVEGAVNVNLHTGYRKPQLILRGDSRDLAQLVIKVQNNSLLVNLGRGYPRHGPLEVEIRSRYLNSFSYTGGGIIRGTRLNSSSLELSIDNAGQTTLGGSIVLRKLKAKGGGNIQISDIRTQYLDLDITGKTKVQLVGVMNISKLDLAGDGLLSMYWLKSPSLKVRGKGHSFVQLAGVVEVLDVELWGKSHFNGRYLRAQRAFVKTHDRAIADISAVKHQHTLATDASDIYFYNIPTTKADFMAFEGSVLDMRDWSYTMQVYDRYNK